jgi:hypothetical protein
VQRFFTGTAGVSYGRKKFWRATNRAGPARSVDLPLPRLGQLCPVFHHDGKVFMLQHANIPPFPPISWIKTNVIDPRRRREQPQVLATDLQAERVVQDPAVGLPARGIFVNEYFAELRGRKNSPGPTSNQTG